jgi:hypothetical protein
MAKWAADKLNEIQELTAKARKALAEVDECQKKLRSMGIKCGISSDSHFVVNVEM